MANWSGRQIGNYQLIGLLGTGGYAEVYLGLHIYLSTPAAVKILHTRLGKDAQASFLHEARIIARLENPYIVRVLDFGVQTGTPYLVMEYASSGSVPARYPEGMQKEPARALAFLQQVAEALHYAHQRNVIHRDVKPENLLLKRSNSLLLSDFGIAIAALNATGQMDIVGTIDYIAPEQLQGYPCAASDQYALGVVAYEWFTGARPFSGSRAEIALQHRQIPPSPLREKMPSISPDLERVVLRALAKDPAARWPSVLEFARALAQTLNGSLRPALSVITRGPDRVDTPGKPSEGEGRTSVRKAEPSVVDADANLRLPLWNVPHRRNPFFTARESVLEYLHEKLRSGTAVLSQPQALSGLGGIGKTQTAVEYAYRYRDSYRAVLWIRAETREALVGDFAALAGLLQLAVKDEQDMGRIALDVKEWLQTHTGWLLILDNVENLSSLIDLLPRSGSILLTTRSQIVPTAARIDLEELFPEEGALFLMRRAKLIGPGISYGSSPVALRVSAREIAELLDGLPLALDQAGAYIEEAGCTLADYLGRYRTQRAQLLRRRGMVLSAEHPEPVATTWSISFEKVERQNPASADLLRFCAFLAPDSISEELLKEGAPELGQFLRQVIPDQSELDEAIRELRTFSLIRRNQDTKTLTIHRLVQAIVRDSLGVREERTWAERVVRIVNRAFPDGEDVGGWPQCERHLPQVYVCAALIDEHSLVMPESARLLNQAGLYLLEHARFSMAEAFLQRSLAIRVMLRDMKHEAVKETDIAGSLNDLGALYLYQKSYAEAQKPFLEALAIYQRVFGLLHADVAVATNNVAMLFYYQGKYVEAEPLFLQALSIWERLREGVRIDDLARTRNNLALLYSAQGRYAEAEPFFREAIATWEKVLGAEHPDVGRTLMNLANLYRDQDRYAEAEPLYHRARKIREQALGADHPDVAVTLVELAKLYERLERYAEAEALYQLALGIQEQALGEAHPSVMDLRLIVARVEASRQNR